MRRVQLIAEYIVLPEHREEALALIAEISRLSRLEPGNLAYTAYQRVEDPNSIALIERYENDEAVDAHRSSAHFRELVLGRLVPLLARRVVRRSEVDD